MEYSKYKKLSIEQLYENRSKIKLSNFPNAVAICELIKRVRHQNLEDIACWHCPFSISREECLIENKIFQSYNDVIRTFIKFKPNLIFKEETK